MGMAHPCHDFGAVCLDLHPAAAPVALLAPPQFAINGVERNWYAGRQARERRYQTLTVGLSSGLESQHYMRLFIVADSNNRPPFCVSARGRRCGRLYRDVLWEGTEA